MDEVMAVLEESQRIGLLGERAIPEVVSHARAFVEALDGVDGAVVDLGSGGGVPGLVVAHDRPDLRITMIDRRQKRTDFLDRMIRRLGWADRVDVRCQDVEAMISGEYDSFDAVVARGFGPPETTLRAAAQLVRREGRIVISEPPAGDRWSEDLLAELGLRRLLGPGSTVVSFERVG